MTEAQLTDILIQNYTNLQAFKTKDEYCTSCSFYYTCDTHRIKPITVFHMPRTMWTTRVMFKLLVKAFHLVCLQGKNQIQTALYFQPIIGNIKVKKNYGPTSAHNYCAITHTILKNWKSVLIQSFNEAKRRNDLSKSRTASTFYVSKRKMVVPLVMEKVLFFYGIKFKNIAQNLLALLNDCSEEYIGHQQTFRHYFQTPIVRPCDIIVTVRSTYYFKWNEKKNLLECVGFT